MFYLSQDGLFVYVWRCLCKDIPRGSKRQESSSPALRPLQILSSAWRVLCSVCPVAVVETIVTP